MENSSPQPPDRADSLDPKDRPDPADPTAPASEARVRRVRYPGRNPRQWQQKYKELRGDAETVAHVISRGKTPAGRHVPILLPEILDCLNIRPGLCGVDCTLGWGGHAEAILQGISPAGRLLGLDHDALQLPLTTERLQQCGHVEPAFTPIRSNFAGLGQAMEAHGMPQADFLLADLGLSSMQIDNAARGFSFKTEGPLDMRMNPTKGITAAQFLQRTTPAKLAAVLLENADEPLAEVLGTALAGATFHTTTQLRKAIADAVDRSNLLPPEETVITVRRVFQAIRIAVIDEFTALDALLRQLPHRLSPGARAAFLTFHSGEDRRVKKAFQQGIAEGIYTSMNREVIRASPEETTRNPRASSAKLRWVEMAG